jgi:hypothetical protein
MPDGATDVRRGAAPASDAARWYRERRFWRMFLVRYIPGGAVANLLWEVAQLPLYTLWTEEPPGFVVYAVLHCTAGDVLIAACVLLAGMSLAAPRGFPERGLARVTIVVTVAGLAYLVFSEWLNTTARLSWTYAPSMPIVPLAGVGLTPFLQWLLLPPVLVFGSFRGERPS